MWSGASLLCNQTCICVRLIRWSRFLFMQFMDTLWRKRLIFTYPGYLLLALLCYGTSSSNRRRNTGLSWHVVRLLHFKIHSPFCITIVKRKGGGERKKESRQRTTVLFSNHNMKIDQMISTELDPTVQQPCCMISPPSFKSTICSKFLKWCVESCCFLFHNN